MKVSPLATSLENKRKMEPQNFLVVEFPTYLLHIQAPYMYPATWNLSDNSE